MVFVAGEFWFFIFFLPYHSFLIFVLQSSSSALSSRSFVGRPHIGKVGKQIAVRPNLVLRHPPVCEDSHERVTGVVGERATIAREGCWAGGIIGHHIGQQTQRRSPCPLWRISTYVLERVCEDGNEAAIVRRFARQVGLSLRSNKKDSLRGQRAAVCLNPILDRADQRTGTAAARAIAAVPSPTLAVPASLYASLMARLDRLGGPAKDLAQIAAAIGREFSHALLASVVHQPEAELESTLDRLIAAGLLFRRGMPSHATYLFKHALVQDAAYGMLLRETRRQLHGRIAKSLEDHFPGTVETQPELIAHHCAQAGLNRKAIEYLGMAGQRAIERSSNPEAIGHLKRALGLLRSLPADLEHAHVAVKLEVMLAQAMIASKGYSSPETMEVLLRAKKLITEATETSQRFTILYGTWACYYDGGEVNKQHVAATEFLSEAETHDDTAALCLAHRALGTTYLTMGEFSAARKHLERAQGLYDPDQHLRYRFQYGQDIGTTVMCYLSWALWHLGFVDRASQLAREAVKRAEEISHPHSLVYTLCHARGMMDVFRRESDDTKSYASVVTSLCSEHAFPFWAAGGQIFGSWAVINHGEVDA